jgi:hypothetical protein
MIAGKVVIYETSSSQDEPEKGDIDLLSSNPLQSLILNQENYQKFIQSHFQSQPVVFRGNPSRVTSLKEILFDLDICEMLKETASDKIHVWLSSSRDKNDSSGQVMNSITVEDPMDAFKLYQVGHSLYCRTPIEFENRVIPSFLHCLGLGIKGCSHDKYSRGEIETFYSRRGHVTAYHTDFQENFTIVLSGKKRWTFHESTAQFPLRGCSPHFASTDLSATLGNNPHNQQTNIQELQLKTLRLGNSSFCSDEYLTSSAPSGSRDPLCSVEISAGDVLYHPAGVWHRVECLEDGISINISLISASYAELFASSLQQFFLSFPQFRQPVNTSRPKETFQVLQEMLNLLPNITQALVPGDILPPLSLHGTVTEGGEASGEEQDEEEDEEQEQESGDESQAAGEAEEEEEEEEEELEEDEEKEEEVILSVLSVECPEDFLPNLTLNQTKKRSRNEFTTFIRRNPLATLMTSQDIDRYNHTESSTSCAKDLSSSASAAAAAGGTSPGVSTSTSASVVPFYCISHSGYGNENYESISRVKIVIDDSSSSSAAAAAAAARKDQMKSTKELQRAQSLNLLSEKLLEKSVSLLMTHFPSIPQIVLHLQDSSSGIANALNLQEFLSLLEIPSLLLPLQQQQQQQRRQEEAQSSNLKSNKKSQKKKPLRQLSELTEKIEEVSQSEISAALSLLRKVLYCLQMAGVISILTTEIESVRKC